MCDLRNPKEILKTNLKYDDVTRGALLKLLDTYEADIRLIFRKLKKLEEITSDNTNNKPQSEDYKQGWHDAIHCIQQYVYDNDSKVTGGVALRDVELSQGRR